MVCYGYALQTIERQKAYNLVGESLYKAIEKGGLYDYVSIFRIKKSDLVVVANENNRLDYFGITIIDKEGHEIFEFFLQSNEQITESGIKDDWTTLNKTKYILNNYFY